MALRDLLIKRANELLQKQSFQPMPGGQPPQDPNAMGMGGDPSQGGGQPMDPSMMGGDPSQGGGQPMDPSMMGGQGMPMDPSMMGGMPPGMGMGMSPPPATIGQLSITDFQTIMMDMLMQAMQGLSGGGASPEAPPEVAPQDDKRTVSNTELSEKVDAILAMLSGAGAAGPEAAPQGGTGEFATPGGPEMGFGGQAAGMPPAGMPPGMPGGMEVQASARPTKLSLADMILKKTAQARQGK